MYTCDLQEDYTDCGLCSLLQPSGVTIYLTLIISFQLFFISSHWSPSNLVLLGTRCHVKDLTERGWRRRRHIMSWLSAVDYSQFAKHNISTVFDPRMAYRISHLRDSTDGEQIFTPARFARWRTDIHICAIRQMAYRLSCSRDLPDGVQKV